MAADDVRDAEELLDALHQRSEQLTNILRSINSGVAVVDAHGRVVLLNDVARTGVGLEYTPELTLADYVCQFDWLAEDGTPITHETFPVTAVLRDGNPVRDVAMSRGEGDEARHFRLSTSPLHGRDDSLIGAVVVFHEVTEMVALQRELESSQEQRLGFYSGMSHELRTPLQGIIGYTELMLESSDEGTFEHDSLTAIRSSCDHLLSLVNELLDISKIVAGRFELHTESTRPSKIIDEAVVILGATAREKGVKLTTDLGDLRELQADPRALRQIILNLISNAVKYTDEGGEVKVYSRHLGDSVCIEVQDSGVGMTPEDLQVIFLEFVQVKGPHGRPKPGTGLGLALTKHFVEMHGGTIEVASEPDVGSTFTVLLPVTD
jgi:signal transduction histidine kinase